jgi:hypothetical protein
MMIDEGYLKASALDHLIMLLQQAALLALSGITCN